MKKQTKTAIKPVAADKPAPKKTAAAQPAAVKIAAPQPAPKKTAPKTQRAAFSVHAEIGSKVFLAGSFNNWDPTAKEMADKKGDGTFTATVALPPGDHQYKFVIDGTWCADPECSEWVQNEHGTLNSVKHVG
jgi:1,4-alpha-glucan branching enzyme